jgi:rubrerythrin
MTSAPPVGPRTVEDLLVEAHALESEAAQRYREFAEIMESHNNGEVAQLFRSIAAQEAEHAEQIARRIGGRAALSPPRERRSPAVAELEQAHYLMQPWHALQIAIEAERRAFDFYASVARASDSEELRKAATQLQAEEREHVALLEQWLGRVPVPPPGWDDDPDPPRYTD